MPNDGVIRPAALKRLQGSEALGGSTVLDFWRWTLGDLRMNNARGYLAEFLVAQAVGDTSSVRVEWGPYDVQATDDTLTRSGSRVPAELDDEQAVDARVELSQRSS